MQVQIIKSNQSSPCSECERAFARYDIQTTKHFLELCPLCFAELLRKAVAVASEMV